MFVFVCAVCVTYSSCLNHALYQTFFSIVIDGVLSLNIDTVLSPGPSFSVRIAQNILCFNL